jgi:hypothetical protein
VREEDGKAVEGESIRGGLSFNVGDGYKTD